MFDTPYVMKLAQNLARHAGARQAQIAKNIANADVPGYRARDLPKFSETYQQQGASADQRTTRAKHMTAGASADTRRPVEIGGESSPNGNNVSLEEEMVRSAQVKSSHDTALSVYKSSLDILRSSLGKGR